MHELFTPLVSTEFSLFSSAAEATKGNALANSILGLLEEKKVSPFSVLALFVQRWEYGCKLGKL